MDFFILIYARQTILAEPTNLSGCDNLSKVTIGATDLDMQ